MASLPGDLPLYSTGLNLPELDLHGGGGFWDEVAHMVQHSVLDADLDAMLGGRTSPRTWVFLDAPDQGPTAAAAALVVARMLADRGQAVVLVDGDDRDPQLTRWIGRAEQEGWIDMVRYGASLHMASDVLPSAGRRGAAVGVGSFTPTGATPDEITELVGRLRRQGDDLVIVARATAAARPWCDGADLCLLGWDRLTRDDEATQRLIDELHAAGIAPCGLVGFGVEEYAAVERLEPDEVKITVSEATAPPIPSFSIDDTAADAEPSRRSSGIFWFVAIAAVVCLLLLGYFYLDSRHVAEPVAVSPAVRELPRASASSSTTLVSAPPETVAQSTPETVVTLAETAPAVVDTTALPVAADDSLYTTPVGRDGWAVWVYSLATEDLAERELRELARKHVIGTYRAVPVKDKGTWYRVYVGNFPSHAAAREAVPALKERLETDWAAPVRF